MFKKDTIGIIGHGFVGEALEKGMLHAFDVMIYDPKYGKTSRSDMYADLRKSVTIVNLDELTANAEVVFVCVPTPMNPDGSASTKIVDTVVQQIAEFQRNNVVVVKSTVPPGTTQRLHDEFQGSLRGVVFNPEFLREISAVDDFKNQTRIILGGEIKANNIVRDIYKKAYPNVPIHKTASNNAELVKYTTNCFLATKVSFANEIYQICESLANAGYDIEYDRVIELATLDERLGKSHWKVPGPMPADDGTGRLLPGWAGSCFIKDLNALMHRARELGVDPKVMLGAWEKNLEVRPERDWENLKGRAVVEKE